MRVEAAPPGGQAAEALRCRDLCVAYGGVTVLADLGLDVRHGEVVALLGASGSGKSSLLNAVAGLVSVSKGEIWVDGHLVTGDHQSTAPERRGVGMVFQNFALWPHLSVIDTVAYPLRRAGRSRRAAALVATELLDQVGIGHLAARRPAQLSGGEQQRVGLARALARNARLYLLDEPTAHLDTHLRAAFQESVLARQRETGAAVVYATHDSAEALALADRVALMDAGRLVQIATPAIVYSEPVSWAAAALTGSCSALDARVSAAPGGRLSVELGAGTVSVAGSGPVSVAGSGPGSGYATAGPRPARLMVRPDWVHLGGPLHGQVTSIAFRGAHTEYRLEFSAGSVLMSMPGAPQLGQGDLVQWSLSQVWVLGGDEDSVGALPQPNAVIAPG